MDKKDMEGQKEAPTTTNLSDLNVLLLGESGVGKSTFVNSFASYLEHDALEDVVESKYDCLIPARFPVTDENFVERMIEIGFEDGEGAKSTSNQGARAYVFPWPGEDRKVRLIDTPGLGDLRNSEQDNANFENVLSYISQFSELHAICFLLKPNTSTINPYFKTSIEHLLSRLDKSVARNVVFVFTNSRSTFFRPNETLPELKRILSELKNEPPHVEIPCSIDNMFCMDNEAFKFLVGLKNDVAFGGRERTNFAESYGVSTRSCRSMLSYVAGLKPYEMQNTLSVNEARRSIIDLTKPLADLADLVEDNLLVLESHQKSILEDNLTASELQNSLYIPCVSLKQTSLPEPAFVCTAAKCADTSVVAGVKRYNFKKCLKKCFLPNSTKQLIGSPELASCAAIGDDKLCTKCGCDLGAHMQLLYETELFEDKLEDESAKTEIVTKQDTIKAQFKMITKLEDRRAEFETERESISKAMAKFAVFLKGNSISIYRDAYEDYIDCAIYREKSSGPNQDDELIKRYVELKNQYVQERELLEKAASSDNDLITPNDIFKCVQSLYTLKHTGKKIRELHKKQQQVRKNEHNTSMKHYRAEPIVKLLKKKQNNSKPKNKTDNLQEINAKIKALKLAGNVDNTELRDLLADYFKQQKEDKDNNPNVNKDSGAVPKMPKKLNNATQKGKNNASGPTNVPKKHNRFDNAQQKQNIPPLMNQQPFPPRFVPPNPNVNQYPPPNYGNFNQYGPQFPPHGSNFPPHGPNFPPQNFPPHAPNFQPQGPNFPPQNPNFMPPNRPNFTPPNQGPGYNPGGVNFKNNAPQQGPSRPNNPTNKQRPKKNQKAADGKKGATFKKTPNRKPSRPGDSDDSDSDRSAADFIKDIGKTRSKSGKDDLDVEMMKRFLEEQKKLMKESKDGKQKGKKVCVMFTSIE